MKADSLLQELPPKHYHGKPCVKCGSTVRLKSDKKCVDCYAQKDKNRQKKHKDRVASLSEDFHVSSTNYLGSVCNKCGSNVRRKSNGRCVNCSREKWKIYYSENSKQVNDRVKDWRKQNPESQRLRTKKNKYRRKVLVGSGASIPYSETELKVRYKTFNNQCAYCLGHAKLTVDHFIPLKLGGHDALYNIVPACQSCNSSKGAKDPVEWMKQKGFTDRIEVLLSLVGDNHENRSSLV